MNIDKILVTWKSACARKRYLVGLITRDENYHFSYIFGDNGDYCGQAIEAGFKGIPGFSLDDERSYQGENLFRVFSSRLPPLKRRVFLKGDLEQDDFSYLAFTGGLSQKDSLEFLCPVESSRDNPDEVAISCIIAGCRYSDITGENFHQLQEGDELDLEFEAENEFDCYAIRVKNRELKIGYVPRVYTRFLSGAKFSDCKIEKLGQFEEPRSCVTISFKAKLLASILGEQMFLPLLSWTGEDKYTVPLTNF